MGANHTDRTFDLYLAALDLPQAEREAYLVRQCAADAELRARITRLLDDAWPEPPAANAASPRFDGQPEQIGPYRILGTLGQGGFGVVYLAERCEPFVQRVAIKVIKPGMDSSSVLARFEQERQALAVMDHPNVAKVLDGGITDPGAGSRPYFVMELVKGETITAFCDIQRLTLRQRLELFVPVCEAVQHAHIKGIIHRDLKPSNILVSFVEGAASSGAQSAPTPTPHDAGAVNGILVKVIDFGVAKAITGTLTNRTIHTLQSQILGTLEYMPPEQADLGALDIDTRADVYSLGVVLYQLLAGVLPFEASELRSKTYEQIQRFIRETQPPAPSKRLAQMARPEAAADRSQDLAASESIAAARQLRPRELRRTLARELEWIPLKAIRKARDRRYLTPLDLARDIRRYLDGRPLLAGPESRWYRARKLVQRHRAPVLAGAGFVFLLATALALTSWLWLRASSAEYLKSQALGRMGNALRVAEQARTEAETQRQRADTQRQRADTQRQRADERAEESLRARDEADRRTAEFRQSAEDMTVLLRHRGNFAAAEPWFQGMLKDVRERFGAESPSAATRAHVLAGVILAQGDLDRAEPLYEEALRVRRKNFGPNHRQVVETMIELGAIRFERGDFARAADLLRDALAISDILPGGERQYITARTDLARALIRLDQFAEAEQLLLAADSAVQSGSRLSRSRNRAVMESLVTLYERWHAAHPDLGHDADARAWKERLAESDPAVR